MRTIAQISDLHFGRHEPAVAEALLLSVKESRPDLVVISGDFTQRARHAEFFEARKFLERIAQPKLVVPGNHDVPLFNLISRFAKPFAKYDTYVAPSGVAAGFYRDEEIAVLGLNTARRFTRKSGRVSREQVALIRRMFSEVPQGIFKVLVTHHPLAYPADATPRELAGRWRLALDAIAQAGVHLLLSGHHHRALSGELTEVVGSVLIVHAGTAISTRIRGGEGNSYNLVRINEDRVSVAVLEWSAGQGFRLRRTLSYRFQDERWGAA